MTVQPDELAEVFEHLGNACAKLSMILKQRRGDDSAAGNLQNIIQKEIFPGVAEAQQTDVSQPRKRAKKNPLAPKATAPPKDPKEPKRPPTAYILFCIDHREILLRDHPDLKFAEISTQLSKMWETSEQKEYYAKALDLKTKYYREREEYLKGKAAEAVEGAAAVISSPVVQVKPKPRKRPTKLALDVQVQDEPSLVNSPVLIASQPPTQEPSQITLDLEAAQEPARRKKKQSTIPEYRSLSGPAVTALEPVGTQPISTIQVVEVPVVSAPQAALLQHIPEIDTQQQSGQSQNPEMRKKKKRKPLLTDDSESQSSSTVPPTTQPTFSSNAQ